MHWPASWWSVAGAGLSVLHGWGPLSLELDLEEIWGSWTAFQGPSSQEAAAFLTLVWWIQGVMSVTLSAVGVVRKTVWGPVQTGWSGSSFQSLTHVSSPCWCGWTQLFKRMGVLSKVSQAIWRKTSPGPGGWDISRSASCWWSPLSFSMTGVVSHIRSQRENSLRALGCTYGGRWESTGW